MIDFYRWATGVSPFFHSDCVYHHPTWATMFKMVVGFEGYFLIWKLVMFHSSFRICLLKWTFHQLQNDFIVFLSACWSVLEIILGWNWWQTTTNFKVINQLSKQKNSRGVEPLLAISYTHLTHAAPFSLVRLFTCNPLEIDKPFSLHGRKSIEFTMNINDLPGDSIRDLVRGPCHGWPLKRGWIFVTQNVGESINPGHEWKNMACDTCDLGTRFRSPARVISWSLIGQCCRWKTLPSIQ